MSKKEDRMIRRRLKKIRKHTKALEEIAKGDEVLVKRIGDVDDAVTDIEMMLVPRVPKFEEGDDKDRRGPRSVQ